MMKHAPALVLASLLALTACGGQQDEAASSRSTAPDQARLKYAQCLRDNGVPNYPDDPSKVPNGISVPEKARKACAKWNQQAGGQTLDPNDPQTRDRFLKLARCMRAHGIDWPDPKPGSLGGPPPDLKGVKNKTKVQAALRICQRGWQTTGSN